MKLLNRNTWDIAEWKCPTLGLVMRVIYKENIPSLRDLRYEDANKVVRYMKEKKETKD